ncbi:class I SAM-dependent methyltransferase [Candidatus Woesearchaeota archaeon]|nr:class I SAM-dependent methyltransferase [Candidatus Woesearchaeota archaeon]
MAHYFSPKQDSELRTREFRVRLRGEGITLLAGSGVFSMHRVDPGSRLLIESAEIRPGTRVLDLGCGYGPMGIAIARAFPDCEVVMTDVNERAVALARKNAKLNRIEATILSGDGFAKVEGPFDAILLNPPQSAGKEVCFSLIGQAKGFLRKGGTLQVVARHNKGGKTLSAKMGEVFGDVRDVAKSGGYRVYISEKSR